MSGTTRNRIVVLGRDRFSTHVIRTALEERFGPVTTILEEPPGVWARAKARVRAQGLWRAIGQVLFQSLAPLLALRQRRRLGELKAVLSVAAPLGPVLRVVSVNSESARRLLRQVSPAVAVVSGTRIIRKKTLECAPAFVNLHAGITPRYRGVHGGYWAMVNDDPANFGATVHLLDSGVDTGAILRQERVVPTSADGFFSYPLLQLKVGLPSLLDAVAEQRVAWEPGVGTPVSSSRQWFHPTIFEYLLNGVRRGIW